MKKFLSLILCVLMLAAALVGCGGSASGSEPAVEVKAVNLEDVKAAIEAVNEVANPLVIDDFAAENDVGLTMENVESYLGVQSNNQGDSATILVVKAAAGKAADVKAELETYKSNQETFYSNYAEFADGLAQIQNGRVVAKGDCVVLVFANTSGADYAEIDKAIDAALS